MNRLGGSRNGFGVTDRSELLDEEAKRARVHHHVRKLSNEQSDAGYEITGDSAADRIRDTRNKFRKAAKDIQRQQAGRAPVAPLGPWTTSGGTKSPANGSHAQKDAPRPRHGPSIADGFFSSAEKIANSVKTSRRALDVPDYAKQSQAQPHAESSRSGAKTNPFAEFVAHGPPPERPKRSISKVEAQMNHVQTIFGDSSSIDGPATNTQLSANPRTPPSPPGVRRNTRSKTTDSPNRERPIVVEESDPERSSQQPSGSRDLSMRSHYDNGASSSSKPRGNFGRHQPSVGRNRRGSSAGYNTSASPEKRPHQSRPAADFMSRLDGDTDSEIQETVEHPDGMFEQDLREEGIQVGRVVKPWKGKAPENESPSWAVRDGSPARDIPHRSVAGRSRDRRLASSDFKNHRSIEKPAPKKGESSKIPSSNIGLTNSLPADIQRAWVQVTAAEFPVRLKVKIIRLSQREQELHLFRSINADGFVRLRISQHVSNITICDQGSMRFLLFDAALGRENSEDFGQLLDGEIGTGINSHSPRYQVYVQLKDGSPEAMTWLQQLREFAKRVEIVPATMPLPAAERTLKTYPDELSLEASKTRSHRLRPAQSDSTNQVRKSARRSPSPPVRRKREVTKSKTAAGGDHVQTRLKFSPAPQSSTPQAGPPAIGGRRSARQSQANQVGSYNEKALGNEVQPGRKTMSTEERDAFLFAYPLEGKAEVRITGGEKERIEKQDFLNDTLVEFGLRQAIAAPNANASKVHLLSSFFYNKISTKKANARISKGVDDEPWPSWPAYDSVKKWTKNKGIFDKDFVIVPINESYHWFLAVIFNPAGILAERQPTPEPVESELKPTTRSMAGKPGDPLPLFKPRILDSPSPERDELPIRRVGASDEERTGSDGDGQQDVEVPASDDPMDGNHEANESKDPLDVMDEGLGDEDRAVQSASQSFRHLSIDAEVTVQHQAISSDGAVEVAQVDAVLQEEKDESDPANKVKDVKPDLQILDGNKCWIMTFDSLGGSHKAVSTVLNKWLQYEARDKERLTHDRPTPAQYVEARVPSQPNFSDCGLFLVHYAEQLLQNPEETIKFIQRSPPRAKSIERKDYDQQMNTVWKQEATNNLRSNWVDRIDLMTGQWKSLQDPANRVPPSVPAEAGKFQSAPPDLKMSRKSQEPAPEDRRDHPDQVDERPFRRHTEEPSTQSQQISNLAQPDDMMQDDAVDQSAIDKEEPMDDRIDPNLDRLDALSVRVDSADPPSASERANRAPSSSSLTPDPHDEELGENLEYSGSEWPMSRVADSILPNNAILDGESPDGEEDKLSTSSEHPLDPNSSGYRKPGGRSSPTSPDGYRSTANASPFDSIGDGLSSRLRDKPAAGRAIEMNLPYGASPITAAQMRRNLRGPGDDYMDFIGNDEASRTDQPGESSGSHLPVRSEWAKAPNPTGQPTPAMGRSRHRAASKTDSLWSRSESEQPRATPEVAEEVEHPETIEPSGQVQGQLSDSEQVDVTRVRNHSAGKITKYGKRARNHASASRLERADRALGDEDRGTVQKSPTEGRSRKRTKQMSGTTEGTAFANAIPVDTSDEDEQ